MSGPSLILASGSAIRAAILKGAGLSFDVIRPDTDEDALKAEMAGASAEEVASALAKAKALSVRAPGALVVGSDQILVHRDRQLDKPKERAEARARLLELQGEAHSLVNAVALVENGDVAFTHVGIAKLYMRRLDAAEIDRYLDAAGPGVLASVGAYQVEGLGARLFERIEGDYFSVLGLSLFPLLSALRARGIGVF